MISSYYSAPNALKPINFLYVSEMKQILEQEQKKTTSSLKHSKTFLAKQIECIFADKPQITKDRFILDKATINGDHNLIDSKDVFHIYSAEFSFNHFLLERIKRDAAWEAMIKFYKLNPDDDEAKRIREWEEPIFYQYVEDFLELSSKARIYAENKGITAINERFKELRAAKHGLHKATSDEEKFREFMIIASTEPVKNILDAYECVKGILLNFPILRNSLTYDVTVKKIKKLDLFLNLDSSNSHLSKRNQKIKRDLAKGYQAEWIAFLYATGDDSMKKIIAKFPSLHQVISKLPEEAKNNVDFLADIIIAELYTEEGLLDRIQNYVYQLEKQERDRLGMSIEEYFKKLGLPFSNSLVRDKYESVNPPQVQKNLGLVFTDANDQGDKVSTKYNREKSFLSPDLIEKFAETIEQIATQRKINKDHLLDYIFEIRYGHGKRGLVEPIVSYSVFSLNGYPVLCMPFSGNLNDVIIGMHSICELRKLIDLVEHYMGIKLSPTIIVDAGMGVSSVRVVTSLQDFLYCAKLKGNEQKSKIKGLSKKEKQELQNNPGQVHKSKRILVADLDHSSNTIRDVCEGAEHISKVEIQEYIRHCYNPYTHLQQVKSQHRSVTKIKRLQETQNINSETDINLSLVDHEFKVGKIDWSKVEENISNSGFDTWITNNPELMKDDFPFEEIIKSQTRQEIIFRLLKSKISIRPFRTKKMIYCKALIVMSVRAVGKLEEIRLLLNDGITSGCYKDPELENLHITREQIYDALQSFKVKIDTKNIIVENTEYIGEDGNVYCDFEQIVTVHVEKDVIKDELIKASGNYPGTNDIGYSREPSHMDQLLRMMVLRFLPKLETLRHLVHCSVLNDYISVKSRRAIKT